MNLFEMTLKFRVILICLLLTITFHLTLNLFFYEVPLIAQKAFWILLTFAWFCLVTALFLILPGNDVYL